MSPVCRHLTLLMPLLLLEPAPALSAATTPYAEPWRPQYHFSPLKGWVGDPDGLVRYQGLYHLFWWGHATSADLVHWTEEPYPMRGDDGSFVYFTGSVILDRGNLLRLPVQADRPPLVAIYTAHRKSDGLETQCLSYSQDHQTFEFFSGNPVLDTGSKAIRDPDVFWDERFHRWTMAIALPEERSVQFLASTNLVSWTPLSKFGPVGARENWWEVPNLFRLPLDGDTNRMRWVLACGMGPNTGQFFVGDFDGTRFVPDTRSQGFVSEGKGLEGEVFADFESESDRSWAMSGEAFGSGSALAARPHYGQLGHRMAHSHHGGDASTGRMVSREFRIRRSCINFLIGGGDFPGQTCLNLVVDGAVIRSATGENSDAMKWAGWDVSALRGHRAHLEIVDSHSGKWGYVSVDHILFSDVLRDYRREHAAWIDWGPDFYAVRGYRDYDHGGRTDCWLGWLGNWEYAQDVPTSWGRGAESIPRTISLVTSSQGYSLRQRPWPGLHDLRGEIVTVRGREIRGVAPMTGFHPTRNAYEVHAVFADYKDAGDFGLNFFVHGTNKVEVGFDPRTRSLHLDRRASSNASFHPKFAKRVTAPLPQVARELHFHVFVDQSSIEVFVNDGDAVMTALVFPNPSDTGLEAFCNRGSARLRSLEAWELKSIWGRDRVER